jgi:hypothetical protein
MQGAIHWRNVDAASHRGRRPMQKEMSVWVGVGAKLGDGRVGNGPPGILLENQTPINTSIARMRCSFIIHHMLF